MKVLVVVDMQNDFIDGSLGSPSAQAIVDKVIKKIKGFQGWVLYTRDTHPENYLETQEGSFLPVKHCIKGTEGWRIHPEIDKLRKGDPIDKNTFGGRGLVKKLVALDGKGEGLEEIHIVGLCTDICVIANALLIKAYFPEVPIIVDSSCCAGVTEEGHLRALESMETCQIIIENK